MRRFAAVVIAVICGGTAWDAAAEELVGKAHVIDGDTLVIAGRRIGLSGIDAPEEAQTCTAGNGKVWRCGLEATFALANKVGNHWVRCKGDGMDAGGRLLAVCHVGKHDLATMMVFQGWALARRDRAGTYVPEEMDAKEHRRGLWRGGFTPPWEWRARNK